MNWNPTFDLPTDDPYTIGIYAAIVLTGIANCFFGHRIFKFALAIILALAGAGAAAYLAVHFGIGSNEMLWVGIALGAVLGLILSFVFVKTAAAVAGAILGYTLLAPNIGQFEGLTQVLVLLAGAGAGALLGAFLANPTIMLATAFIGAFQLVYGGLFFVDGTQILVLGEDASAGWHLLAARQWPFIAMVALGCLGTFVQLTRRWREKRES